MGGECALSERFKYNLKYSINKRSHRSGQTGIGNGPVPAYEYRRPIHEGIGHKNGQVSEDSEEHPSYT
jgi:hypothetical protein